MAIDFLKNQLSPIVFNHGPGPFGKLIYDNKNFYRSPILNLLLNESKTDLFLTCRVFTQIGLGLITGYYVSQATQGNLTKTVAYTALVIQLYVVNHEFDLALAFPTCVATLLTAWKIIPFNTSYLDNKYIKYSLPLVFVINQIFWHKFAYPLTYRNIKREDWVETLSGIKDLSSGFAIEANLALFNDWLAVNSHIATKDQLNFKDAQGNTFLHNFNFENFTVLQSNIFKEFIKAGLDLNIKNQLGQTPLHCALLRKEWKSVISLIYHGANVKDQDKQGNMIYHLAALQLKQSNDPEFSNFILDAISPELLMHRDKKENTILHLLIQAAELNKPLIIKLIVDILNKVKNDIYLFVPNQFGKTPLMILVEKDQIGLLYDIDPFLHDQLYDQKFSAPDLLQIGNPNPFLAINPHQDPNLVLNSIRTLLFSINHLENQLKFILRYRPNVSSKKCAHFMLLPNYSMIIKEHEKRLPSSTEWFAEEATISISNYPIPEILKEIPSVTGTELNLSREKLKQMLVNSFFLLADLFNGVTVDPAQSNLPNYMDIEIHGRKDSIIDHSWKHYLLTYRKGLKALFRVLYERHNIGGAPIAPSFEKVDDQLRPSEKIQREELNVYYDNLVNQLIHITSKLSGWSLEQLAQQPNPEKLLLNMTPEENVNDLLALKQKENPNITSIDVVNELLAKNHLHTPLKVKATENSDLLMQRCSAIMDFSIISSHCGVRYESDFFAWYRLLNGEAPNIPLDERIFRFLSEKRSNFFDMIIRDIENLWRLNDTNNLHNAALFHIGKERGLAGNNLAYSHDVYSPIGNSSQAQIENFKTDLLLRFDLWHSPSKIVDILDEAINGLKTPFGERIPQTKVFPQKLIEQWLKENIEKFIPITKRSELENEARELFNEEWQSQNPHQNKEDEINKYIKESYYWSHLYKNNLFTREAIKAILLYLKPSFEEESYLTQRFNLLCGFNFSIINKPFAFKKDMKLTFFFEKALPNATVRLITNGSQFFEHIFGRSAILKYKRAQIKNSQVEFNIEEPSQGIKSSFYLLVEKALNCHHKYEFNYTLNNKSTYIYNIIDRGEVFQSEFGDELL